ncbi:carboxypeptidase-like regulatory domain-containing protein [Flavivirga aquatica]|uniref:carboxypeptidase-like regulatory domain-containing protein n=1 Tax=Flavivirga aquatica TaxID=1849968 RepID=UPI0013F4CDA5|nr:carboxypeptidase-like regulatory domain-containing protein [Flavivirga aquatica]
MILVFLSSSINSQTINRVEVNGVILADNNDVEAVTIFNSSSNKGTITNSKGLFKIAVSLNDIIEVSALQFQTVSIIIDADVLKSKELKIHLVEQINKLDAVTLSSGLTGNMGADIQNVKTVKPITINMGNMSADFEYYNDKAFDSKVTKDHLKSIKNPDDRDYLPDLVKIVKLFVKKKKNRPSKKDKLADKLEKQALILDVYTDKYISENFNIPLVDVVDFVRFIEKKGVKSEFLMPENEIQLVEFLIKQSQSFLKLQNAKN